MRLKPRKPGSLYTLAILIASSMTYYRSFSQRTVHRFTQETCTQADQDYPTRY